MFRTLFIIIVALPTLCVLIYSYITDSPLYKSHTEFAIQERSQGSVPSLGALMSSVGLSSNETQSIYALKRYIESPDALMALEDELGFAEFYQSPNGDWLTRLSNSPAFDTKYRYYGRVTRVHISTTENIVTLEVLAFSPEEAQRLARGILQLAERFINEINIRFVEDEISFHETERQAAEERLLKARDRLTNWRSETNVMDPNVQIQMIQGIIGELEQRLSTVRADIAVLESSSSTQRNEAKIDEMRDLEAILELQIAATTERMVGTSDSASARQLQDFGRLQAEVEFAERYLESSITSLEAARQIAVQKQKYLLPISNPTLPSKRNFPVISRHVPLTFLVSLIIFGIASLLYTIIRDFRAG